MTENFPQINVRQKTTDPGNSESIKQDECPPTPQTTPKHIFFKLQQINLEGKKKDFPVEEHLTSQKPGNQEERNEIFSVLRKTEKTRNKHQARNLYPMKLPLKNGEVLS